MQSTDLERLPHIPNVTFRLGHGEKDASAYVTLLHACQSIDGIDAFSTLEGLRCGGLARVQTTWPCSGYAHRVPFLDERTRSQTGSSAYGRFQSAWSQILVRKTGVPSHQTVSALSQTNGNMMAGLHPCSCILCVLSSNPAIVSSITSCGQGLVR